MKKLSELIIEKNKYLPLVCNGNGTCGKCKVRIRGCDPENVSGLSACEKRLLLTDEQADCIRLACQTYVSDDFDIADVEILSSEEDISTGDYDEIKGCNRGKAKSLCIAIDIGTTTIQGALIDNSGNVLEIISGINHQRSFGADVISRIDSAARGYAVKLREIIVSDLNVLITGLLRTVTDKEKVGRAFPHRPFQIRSQF